MDMDAYCKYIFMNRMEIINLLHSPQFDMKGSSQKSAITGNHAYRLQ